MTSAKDDVSVHLQSQPMVPTAYFPPSHVFVNLLPSGIALGDLNGDGALDAAVVNQLSSDVSLLLNDGHGKVVKSAAGDWPVPREPVAVELLDLNRDSKPDLVVRSAVSSSLTVLLSLDGGFQARSRRDYPLSSAPAALVMVDLDGDQAPEAVVALKDGTVRVLWNDGRGTLGQGRESRVAVALDTTALGVGDLDLDGYPDVLAATGAEQRLYVLHNTGLAGGLRELQPSASYPAARRPTAIAVADFDGDLLPDVAVADAAQSAVSIFLNQSK